MKIKSVTYNKYKKYKLLYKHLKGGRMCLTEQGANYNGNYANADHTGGATFIDLVCRLALFMADQQQAGHMETFTNYHECAQHHNWDPNITNHLREAAHNLVTLLNMKRIENDHPNCQGGQLTWGNGGGWPEIANFLQMVYNMELNCGYFYTMNSQNMMTNIKNSFTHYVNYYGGSLHVAGHQHHYNQLIANFAFIANPDYDHPV